MFFLFLFFLFSTSEPTSYKGYVFTDGYSPGALSVDHEYINCVFQRNTNRVFSFGSFSGTITVTSISCSFISNTAPSNNDDNDVVHYSF